MSKELAPKEFAYYLITQYFCLESQWTYCEQSASAPDFPGNIVIIKASADDIEEFRRALRLTINRPNSPVCPVHKLRLEPILVKLEFSPPNSSHPPFPTRI